MGNSEVGHMNIGAGRVVMQDLPRIDAAIDDGSLARNPLLADFIAKLKKSGGACHLMGLPRPAACIPTRIIWRHWRNLIAGAGVPVWCMPSWTAATRRPRARWSASPHIGWLEARPASDWPLSPAAITPWTATSAGTVWRWPMTRWSRPRASAPASPMRP